MPAIDSGSDILDRLASVIETRKPGNGGKPDASYVARLLQGAPDAFLKKIGEEATEVVMASKDLEQAVGVGGNRAEMERRLVGEFADLWFHCLVALAHHGLHPGAVLAELARREGTSGIEEKSLRKAQQREATEHAGHARRTQEGEQT